MFFLIFIPGEMIQFDEHLFLLGWFNHQHVFQTIHFYRFAMNVTAWVVLNLLFEGLKD